MKARLRPMRELKTDRIATLTIEGQAFIHNLGRDNYELGVDTRADGPHCAAAFDEVASMICTSRHRAGLDATPERTTQQSRPRSSTARYGSPRLSMLDLRLSTAEASRNDWHRGAR